MERLHEESFTSLQATRPQFVESLAEFELSGLHSQEALHVEGPGGAFIVWMGGLYQLLAFHPYAAFECPLMLTRAMRGIADLSLYVV